MEELDNPTINPQNRNRVLVGAAAAVALAAAGPALAQRAEDDRLPEQVTMDKDLAQEGADILVNQAAPTVIVEQPKPTVTVTQPPPEISIRQPAPTIRVIMPEPEVTIDQAQPKVDIQMPEPKVRIQQAEAEVQVNRAPVDVLVADDEPQVQVQSAGNPKVLFKQSGRPTVHVEQAKPKIVVESTPQPNQAYDALISMKGNEIVGQPLMAASGQPLGEIDNLVIDKQSAQLFAVVAVDDAVPGNMSLIAIPLQQMQFAHNELRVGWSPQQITTDMSYTEGQYQPIELGVPLHEYEVVAGR